jgi:hypothetical protein
MVFLKENRQFFNRKSLKIVTITLTSLCLCINIRTGRIRQVLKILLLYNTYVLIKKVSFNYNNLGLDLDFTSLRFSSFILLENF